MIELVAFFVFLFVVGFLIFVAEGALNPLKNYSRKTLIAQIETVISKMTPECREAVRCLRVWEPPEEEVHFKTHPLAAAHCERNGTICVRQTYFMEMSDECSLYIYHEVGHARWFAITEEGREEWRQIAGNVYGGEKAILGRECPLFSDTDGILRKYGRVSDAEDVAVWVGDAYYACYETHNFQIFQKYDGSDRRYRLKLDWLLQYKFIDRAMYDEILPCLK